MLINLVLTGLIIFTSIKYMHQNIGCFESNQMHCYQKKVQEIPDLSSKKILLEESEIDEKKIWINRVQDLLTTESLMKYVYEKKRTDFDTVEELANYLNNGPAKNELELFWMIYVWIAENIEYNAIGYKSGNLGNNEALNVLRKGLAVCEGFSNLYDAVCKVIGLECVKLSGYSKGIGFNIGDKFTKTNHAWNAIKIDGKWYYLDTTWASRKINDFNKIKDLSPYWFMTPPNIFLESHYSPEMKLHRKCTKEEFENLHYYELEYHVLGLKNDFVKNSRVICNSNPCFIEFTSLQNLDLLVNLKDGETEIPNSIIYQKDLFKTPIKYGVIIFTEFKNRDYSLEIFGKSVACKKTTYPQLTKFILRRQGDETKAKIPDYNISFLNGNVNLSSHNSSFIYFNFDILFIELTTLQDYYFSFVLKDTKKQVLNSIIYQKDSSSEQIKHGLIILTEFKNTDYSLEIYGKRANSKETRYPFIERLILRRHGDETEAKIPDISFLNGKIKFLSHKSLFIKYDSDPLILEFSAPLSTEMLGNLTPLNSVDGIDKSVLVQKNPRNSNILIYIVSPEAKKRMILNLFSTETNEKAYPFIGSLQIFKTNEKNTEKGLVTKYSCDNEFFIYEPIKFYLKLNKIYQFKFYVEKAITVLLTNVRGEGIYLDRSENEENIYEIKYAPNALEKLTLWAKFYYGSKISGLCYYEVKN